MSRTPITVPDLGDFDAVEIIEVLISVGDTLSAEDPVVTLETDKATMDIPAPQGGKVVAIDVSVGDKVSQGDVLAHIEATATSTAGGDSTAAAAPAAASPSATSPTPTAAPTPVANTIDADAHSPLVVIGGGVAGYTAAFRAFPPRRCCTSARPLTMPPTWSNTALILAVRRRSTPARS
jgi:dihydrolipoamide dehydrogenase